MFFHNDICIIIMSLNFFTDEQDKQDELLTLASQQNVRMSYVNYVYIHILLRYIRSCNALCT